MTTLTKALRKKSELQQTYLDALTACDQAGVPIEYLAQQLHTTRATIYRQLAQTRET